MAFSLRQPTVGLVIRAGAVELVQLSRGLKGVKVLGSVRVPLGDPQVSAQPEDARVAEAIRKALESVHARGKRVAVAMPPHEVLLRAFSMPAVPKAEWESAIQFEARKYLPFKLTDLVWDYAVSPRSGDQTLDVVFVALERQVFARLQGWLAAAGLEATLLEPQSFSLARVARLSQQTRADRFAVMVDAQPEHAHIAVVRNGLAYLARDVSLQAGASAQTDAPATPGHDVAAERLLSELRLSVDFFTRQFAGAAIDRIVLFGEASRVSAWCRAFAPHLGCPVEPGRLPGDLGLLQDARFASGTFAAAVGTALGRRGSYRAVSLNLLKRSQPSVAAAPGGQWSVKGLAGRLNALNRPVLGGAAAVAIALLCALWVFAAHEVRSVQRQLALAVEHRADVGWGLTGRSQADLERIGQSAREQLAFLRRVVEGRVSVAAKLDALVRSLPEGMWLTGLQYDDQPSAKGEARPRLTLEGACFLGEGGQEVSVIQQFEERTRQDANFYQGFATSKLGPIAEQSGQQEGQQQAYTFRTFELEYGTDRRL